MPGTPWTELAPACRRADLSIPALYLRYVGLGGLASSTELANHVTSGGPLTALEHEVIVHAVNERFLELRQPERLPYQSRGLPQ